MIIIAILILIFLMYKFVLKKNNKTEENNSSGGTEEIQPFEQEKIINDVQKEVPRRETEEDRYIKQFQNIEKYNFSTIISEEFITKLKRTKEVEFDNFIKLGGTTKRPESFVVFDLETTGLSYSSAEIIEIGAIKFIDGIPKQTFHTYVKPIKKITKKITSINGITNEMVENSPSIEEVIPHFINFIEDYVLIAHNSDFDTKFILNVMYNMNYKKIKNKCIDTLKLSRQKVREYDWEKEREVKLSSYKLEELKMLLGLYDLPSHNALDDCKVCAYLYINIIQQCGDTLCL